MLNLIKMDLRRTFRTPLLYALLLGLGVVTGGIGDFVPVLVVAVVWLLVSLGCSLVTMKKKDI